MNQNKPETTMRLILVRHGETDWNTAGRYQGQADPPLNAKGRAQAQTLALDLMNSHIDAIYSSDLQRARETAEIVSGKLGLVVTYDRRLREMNLGEWEGLLESEIIAGYPVEWDARAHDPLGSRAPGGESLLELAERLWASANDIGRAHPTDGVLIISHGLALATLLCRARGLPLQQARQLIPDNALPEIVEWISF